MGVSLPSPRRAVSARALAVGLGHFSFMFLAGVQMSVALTTLSTQSEHPVLKAAWEDVHRMVETGHKLSEAFGRQPHVFPPMVVMMTKAGEETGDLGGRLKRAAELLDRRARYQARFGQALAAPLATAAFSGLVVAALVKYIVPRFTAMYDAMQVQLPWLTQAATTLVRAVNHPSFPAVLLMLAAFVMAYQTQLRSLVFRLLLWLPWTRQLVASRLAVEFCDMLSSLYQSGVPINRALVLLAQSAEEERYAQMLHSLRREVEQGVPMAAAVRAQIPFFPRVVAGMLEVGATTGALDKALTSVQSVLDLDVDSRLQSLQVSLEPILMALLGATLTGFFIALMMPMYQLIEKLTF